MYEAFTVVRVFIMPYVFIIVCGVWFSLLAAFNFDSPVFILVESLFVMYENRYYGDMFEV